VTRPLTSIVILTLDQLAYTTQCVDGIIRHTPEPYELVFVDNGSTDGTLEYLRSLSNAVVIDNDSNLGFGAGCNQGIAASRGERILLLNNDVVPTAGWLSALHEALDRDPANGLAGPRTNRIVGCQQIDAVDYDQDTLVGLEPWAAAWCAQHAGSWSMEPRLIGFCILMEAAVVEQIGGFDLRYGIGNFEDDDLCLRAGIAGWRCTVAQDSFVHHFGSRTFVGRQIDYSARIADSYARFARAWNLASTTLDSATGSYPITRILETTRFDPTRHYAPLVAVADSATSIQVPTPRDRVVVVCCDRFDPIGTRAALSLAFTELDSSADASLVVRIDPRDPHSLELLDDLADACEPTAVPDVIVVQSRDEDDRPVLRLADQVVVAGRSSRARAQLARRMGVTVIDDSSAHRA
jgi:GT2 family glycosyltransferase